MIRRKRKKEVGSKESRICEVLFGQDSVENHLATNCFRRSKSSSGWPKNKGTNRVVMSKVWLRQLGKGVNVSQGQTITRGYPCTSEVDRNTRRKKLGELGEEEQTGDFRVLGEGGCRCPSRLARPSKMAENAVHIMCQKIESDRSAFLKGG